MYSGNSQGRGVRYMLSFLITTINSSTSILLGALGILFMQLAGVLNIGAESMMLIGAFVGVLGSSMFGNVWGSVLMTVVCVGITGLVFGFCTIMMKANQVVVGVAFNILAEGLTTTLYRGVFGMQQGTLKVASFGRIGPFSLPVYFGFFLVIALTIFFYKTKFGLEIRGAGEYPLAIDSMGLSVNKIRYISVVIGSIIIGLGGAYLSLGQLSFFTEDMVSGRGFIALAAVIFGRYLPIGTWLAVLVFGIGETLVYRLQAINCGISLQLILMIPYVLTVVIVSFFGQKASGPQMLGIPFDKDAQ
jgi:simple sugar transport system permease protein